MIWKTVPTLELLAKRQPGTMIDAIGIEFTEVGDDFIRARMPVDQRTLQPAGLLHGGASVALAETLGSVASLFCLERESGKMPVGIEINANHLRSMRSGSAVIGEARALHLGRTTHVWEIKIRDEESEKLVCVSRLTVAIVPKA